ncbi:MAG: hypothetical protein IPN76_26210 [Saprospiraceae bacterium]|nr:hypothetical protein [Saprospiraceae bacterium]
MFTDSTILVILGGSKTIDLGFDETVSNNVYVWFKGNTPIDTVIGDNSRTFSNIQPNQLGTYYVKVTNPMAPQLTLRSRPITLTATPPCNPQQDRTNLINFFDAMGGNGWDKDDNWGMGNNLQNWYGIQVNAQGCVVTIDLDDNTANPDWAASPNGQGNNLIGQLPQALFNLPYLEKLFLRNNVGITGPLPNTIGDLIQLRELSLSKTGLTSAIPANIGNLYNLVYFEIDHTNISGPLPVAIGSLSALRYLEIDNNPNLNGNLPNILGNLLNLQGLYANHCDFDGPIPPGLAMLPQLNTLELQHNRLEGTVPVFSGLVLQGLRLDTNRLENLPPLMLSSLGNNPWQGLQVQMNRFTFEDILPNMGIFNSNPPSVYHQQDSIFAYDTITINVGDNLIIDLNIDDGVTNNTYTWYHQALPPNGPFNSVANSNGPNSNIFSLPNIHNTGAGRYWCEVNNPNASQLTLHSRWVLVNLNCPAPPSVLLAKSSDISCSTPTVTLTATPLAGATYAWSAGATPPTANTVFVTAAGIYTVTVTAANGCTGSAMIVVLENTTPPIASLAKSSDISCLTQVVTLTATPLAGVTYAWSAGATPVPGTNMATVTAAGTYTVTVTAVNNGCTDNATIVVSENNTPPSAEAGPPATITCASPQATLNGAGSSTGAGITYLWTTNGGNILSGATTLTPVVNEGGTYTLTVTNTSSGCTALDNVTVMENNTTTAVAGPPVTITCASPLATLNGAGSSTGAGITYQWVASSGGNILSGATTLTR